MKVGNIWEDFEWTVASDYEWRDTQLGLSLAIAPGATIARKYRPLGRESAGLFQTFADVEPTPEAVMKFAREFGLLGVPLSRFTNQAWQFDPGLFGETKPLREGYLSLGGENALWEPLDATADDPSGLTWSWRAQITELAEFTHWLKHRSDPSLSPDGRYVEAMDVANGTYRLSRANRILANTVAPRLLPTKGFESLTFQFEPHSLIGAIWLQAAQAAAEGVRYRKCETCGRPIAVARTTGARADAKFCSNACRSHNYRTRQAKAVKLSNHGWSPSRIAKRLQTDAATVRGWIK